MREFGIKVLVNAVALWVAALVVSGIEFEQSAQDGVARKIGTILVVAIIFGLINAIIKPVVKFFAFPFIILTLGLLTLIINAAMLELTSWVAGSLHLAFHVDDFFWDAVLGGIIITFVSLILNLILPEGDRVHR